MTETARSIISVLAGTVAFVLAQLSVAPSLAAESMSAQSTSHNRGLALWNIRSWRSGRQLLERLSVAAV
jgi:hypothetical protein